MAATSSAVVASSTLNSAAFLPSRSTTMRSATAWTSAMLWLIRMTPRPCSRSRSMRLRTSAVCATPRAAVGSSSITTLGLPTRLRAMATVWRWPPERDAIGIRTLGIFAERVRSSRHASFSMVTSSMNGSEDLLLAEEEVGHDVEVVAQGEVLEDGGDAEGLGLGRAAGPDGLAVEGDVAVVGRVDPRDHLDERGLAGAVVADQGDDLARPDVHVDVREGLDGTEALGDAGQGEDNLPGRRTVCSCGGHQEMPAASHALAYSSVQMSSTE